MKGEIDIVACKNPGAKEIKKNLYTCLFSANDVNFTV